MLLCVGVPLLLTASTVARGELEMQDCRSSSQCSRSPSTTYPSLQLLQWNRAVGKSNVSLQQTVNDSNESANGTDESNGTNAPYYLLDPLNVSNSHINRARYTEDW